MKSLSVKLGVVLIGLAIFGNAELWGADWRILGETNMANFFYDADSITRPSRVIVKVWVKTDYTEKGIITMVGNFGSAYENLKFTLNLFESNCSDKMMRILATNHVSQNRESLRSFNYGDIAKWEFIPPGSVQEELYKAVCK